MKKLIALVILAVSAATAAAAGLPKKPKLVLVIVIDQFRYDYLTRFRSDYKGGLDQLLTRGAVFTNAYHEHFPTVTGVGHGVIMTGALPSVNGIIGNDWFDREAGKSVACVLDESVQILGGSGRGASPRRLLVSTVGDELERATGGKSRVIGISLKDRAAIFPAGSLADAAFWYDSAQGNFVSSTYYFPDLPAWVKDFNALKLADGYRGAAWLDHKLPEDEKIRSAVISSPFGNDLLEAFAERTIQAEDLGRDDTTDLLTVSFSSDDYVGHSYGPESPEVRQVSNQADRMIEKLFRYVNSQIGMQNVLVVLTGDHGTGPLPGAADDVRNSGGRLPSGIVQKTVQEALVQKYGEGNWILNAGEPALYLNTGLILQKKLDLNEFEDTVRDAVLTVPHMFRAYTRHQLIQGAVSRDFVAQRVLNGYNVRRGGNVVYVPEPYWVSARSGATHGSAFHYDAHVPVIFMGPGIRAGRYDREIAVFDIAPTLASLLDVETPSGSSGRVLTEILQERR
jgi:predicted AlkP superfamily pyrophosphatase or phosphodiesterase